MMRVSKKALMAMGACFLSLPVFAQSEGPVAAEVLGGADLVWVMISMAMVMLMQAGFALLESGATRTKNSINVLMKNYTDMTFGSLLFWGLGYGLMFGYTNGWVGTSHFAPGVGEGVDFAVLLFQLVFVATAATIVSGAVAERTKYWSYIAFTVILTGVIYPVFGSWVWGGIHGGAGWLSEMGFHDFAGSTVVHSVGGWAALVAIYVIGPRLGRFSDGGPRDIPGHNLGMVALGGFILWFGWFGFNGGSTLGVSEDIGKILLNTQLAASAGVVGAMVCALATKRPLLLVVAVNGGLGGLVGITAGCDLMSPGFAVVTGLIAGGISLFGSDLLLKMKLDDVVGAVPVHGFCGVWGTLCCGLFAEGDLFNWKQVGVQAIGVGACFLWTAGTCFVVMVAVKKILGVRADTMGEQRGLDFVEHGEIGYPEFVDAPLHRGVKK